MISSIIPYIFYAIKSEIRIYSQLISYLILTNYLVLYKCIIIIIMNDTEKKQEKQKKRNHSTRL